MDAGKIEKELTDEEYRDELNELYPSVEICGYTMYQGDILYYCDRIAFNEHKNNYEDTINRDDEIWKCGKCGHEYDNEDCAQECCIELIEDTE